jgi:hypothetical protein
MAIHSCFLYKKYTNRANTGKLNTSSFTYAHFTHKVLILFNGALPNALFPKNKILVLDVGLLVIIKGSINLSELFY